MRLGTALVATAVGIAVCAVASPATAAIEFKRMDGFNAPGTPNNLDRVGVLKVGPKKARNVLILNPGTSASAAYFRPLASWVASRAKGWQVWAVERRENLLEDHSVFNQAKAGTATPQETFDYYFDWVIGAPADPSFEPIPDADVTFARNWGMRVEIGDLRRVVKAAERHASKKASRGGRRARKREGKVVVGGHSLGGSITTAYATWDFNGEPGARGLSGLVYIDGGSSPTPITAQQAQQALDDLQGSTPWLSFGGIPAPLAGLFNTGGSLSALIDPDAPSIGQQNLPLEAFGLEPPCPVTNLAQYGFALDSETSPPGLIAAQAHLGMLDESTEPCDEQSAGVHGWDQAGEITPIRRYATMFSGMGLRGLDGTAWYHPRRLTIDSGAVAAGNRNPAQRILNLRAIHGDDLPRKLRIYAFGAALGREGVLDAARGLAAQSRIPQRNLTLVNRQAGYSHNDPNSAFPDNDFVERLVPFLNRVKRAG
jgi:pimeloyl-ACP methyl ester carboxylesterase